MVFITFVYQTANVIVMGLLNRQFLICSFVLSGSFGCFGQESEKRSFRVSSKQSLELYCSPFSKALPEPGKMLETGMPGDYLNWYKNSSETGLKYGYTFHPRFCLKLGLAHYLYRIGSYDYYEPLGSENPLIDTKSSVHTLALTFGMNVLLFGKHKRFKSYACFSGTFFQYLQLISKNTYSFPDGTVNHDTERTRVDNRGFMPLRGSFGLRFEYQATRRIFVSIEPNLSFGYVPIKWYDSDISPIAVSKIEWYYPVGVAYCF